MQGLFVLAGEFEEEVVFTTTAPAKGKALKMSISCDLDASTGSAATVIDNATIRFGEGRSLEKFQLNPSHSKLYLMQDNKAYAVVQSDAQGEMILCFKAKKDGIYTLNFSNEEITFDYLHLIDSLTGEDVDLLHSSMQAEQSYPDQPVFYTFTAKTTDNANRFRLVFY